MKLSSLRRFATFALATPLLALSVGAAGFEPAIVSADARWVVFADLAALRTSTLGQELVNAVEKAQTRETGGKIGLNVPKLLMTIGTLTAYGTNLSKDPQAIDGALIARGTEDLRKIAESIMLQGTIGEPEVFSEVEDLPFPAYAISDPKAKGEAKDKTQVIVAFPPEPIVIVSKSKAQLLKAREVFRGSAPSLAKSSGSALAKISANARDAYLFAGSAVPTDPIFPQEGPQARILQLANSGSLAIGERGPDAFAHAELVASSGRNAERLTKILEGLTAMLSLAESNDRELAEFLRSTHVTRDEDTVTLRLDYSSARLVDMMQALQQQMKPRPASRKPVITHGETVSEWSAAEAEPAEGTEPNALSWRTLEKVKLTNGVTITVGRAANGGKPGKIERVEITPAGGGAPLTFSSDFMRHRGMLTQIQFPGVEGLYTVRVGYVSDPERKATYAVSVFDPKAQPPAPPAPPRRGPVVPEPKWK
jgi:hypothetical protein